MDRRVFAYVASNIVIALVAVFALHQVGFTPDEGALRASICFALLGLVAQVSTYTLSLGAGGSMSSLPFLTAGVLAPSVSTALMVTACMAASEILRKTAVIKRVFNVAQLCLAVSVAISAYVLLGGGPLRDATQPNLPAYVALVVLYQAVNTLAVSGVVAISSKSRLWPVWRRNTLAVLGYDLVALPAAYCFAVVYLKLGVPGVFLLGLLLLGARQLYSTNRQLDKANRDLLEVMVAAIELRDPYTSGHSQRVAAFSVSIGRAIGLNARAVDRLRVAALLHDVGKIDQRFAAILQKPGRLTDDERAIIELHPVISADLVSRVSGLRDILPPVRHHHERWDGNGYPDRLAGEAIPLFARIITFADTIDAMTTDRPYRKALGSSDVRAELLRNRGKQFDPMICDRLLASPAFQDLFAPVSSVTDPAAGTEAVVAA
jgi:HD superfamily phosphohydrolase YqeK